MFLSPIEFTGDMPESYRNTSVCLQSLIIKLKGELEETRDLQRADNIKNQISIINSMLTDSSILAIVTARYYDTSYNNPKPFSMVQVPEVKGGQFGDVDYDEKVLMKIFGKDWRD